MGVDFVAILSHQFDNSNILSVPVLLNADKELRTAVAGLEIFRRISPEPYGWHWKEYGERWTGTNPEAIWRLEDDQERPIIALHGPADSRISFGRSTCTIEISTRNWARFVEVLEYQNPMRRACYTLAKILGGSKAMYVPDSSWSVSIARECVYENFTLERIHDFLLRTFGTPVVSLKNPQALMPNNPIGGYYLDDFKDLETRPESA